MNYDHLYQLFKLLTLSFRYEFLSSSLRRYGGKSVNSNYYKIILKLLHISYGSNLLLKGCPVIFNKSGATMTIGNGVTIKSSFLSNLVGLYSRTIIVTRSPEAEIKIGNNVGISGATIYARKSIIIGDNTNIGGNVKILDNDFHPIEIEARNDDNKEKINTRPIVIGKNCFIGCNALILKGTELGDGCVVGAGAVVCGSFLPNSVIVGNPAKIIKTIDQ
ncbi:DapH/DapD/GlmU-related protein [Clostridium sp. BJN0013]|uniref:acyltransferase n=1 Tax=Clostridium sp. BJN0013 TaxID=3236840 RepID=UPI0034C641AC